MLELYLTLVDSSESRDKLIEIYEKYKRLIKYVALQVYNNDEFAEDIVHDTVLILIDLLNRGKIGDAHSQKTKSLVATIAKRTAINCALRDKKINYIDTDTLTQIADTDDGYSVVLAKDLLDAIKKMPDIYRETLELYAMHDMSPRQIALILKISEGAVRKRLQRARDLVKEILDNM